MVKLLLPPSVATLVVSTVMVGFVELSPIVTFAWSVPPLESVWCAPRQVDSEIIYILRMKILPAYHMVLGAMQPVDGHGLP